MRIFQSLYLSSILAINIALSGCATPPPQAVSEGHIQERPKTPSTPPPLVRALTPPPINPAERKKIETYSVVVKDVDIRDLLFSLARDAKVDVDISPDVKGSVTINAVKQSLPQILERLSANFNMAYEVVDGVYRITQDKPVLRSYRVEYPNISRKSTSKTSLAALDNGLKSGEASAEVSTDSNNLFWTTLISNIKDILRETDKEVTYRINTSNNSQILEKKSSGLNEKADPTNKTNAPQADKSVASATPKVEDKETLAFFAANVIANPETGIIQVRATQRQHAKVREFLDLVLSSSQRQVLIEATVAEVELLQQYEKGIDWAAFGSLSGKEDLLLSYGGNNSSKSLINFDSARAADQLGSSGIKTFELGYKNISSATNTFLSSIRLLENFGSVKVLSSPKISVLNNQTALLKVVNNEVYFVVTATAESTNADGTTTKSVKTATPVFVPVGIVLGVTPFISNNNVIQMNVRPSISRILRYKEDPATDGNQVPIVNLREMESIMNVTDGNIAVLGGLMQDSIEGNLSGIPGLTRNVVGEVLGNRVDNRKKTELVIFIRPRIVRNADLSGDYADFQRYMLNDPAFQAPHPALQQQ